MKQEENHHKVFLVGFVLIILVIAWFLAKPFFSNTREKNITVENQALSEEILKAPSISAEDLLAKLKRKEKVFVLDMNQSAPFNAGHIEKSFDVEGKDLSENFLGALGIEKTSDIALVGSGDDIGKAAASVNDVIATGYVNCRYLEGGLEEWKSNGFPLVSRSFETGGIADRQKISIKEIEEETGLHPEIIQFVDVRSKEDFAREHIFRATNIPLSELESRYGEIPPTKKIIICGSSQEEAAQAVSILFDLNYFNVFQMEGILSDWKQAGGKTE